jgi:hypothetical protein
MHFHLTSLQLRAINPNIPAHIISLPSNIPQTRSRTALTWPKYPSTSRVSAGHGFDSGSVHNPLVYLFFKYFVFIFSVLYPCNPVTAFFPPNNSLTTAIHADPWISRSKFFLLPSSLLKLWLILHSFYPGYYRWPTFAKEIFDWNSVEAFGLNW